MESKKDKEKKEHPKIEFRIAKTPEEIEEYRAV